MSDGRLPIGLAMIVCDNIHVDPNTGKRTILGTLTNIRSQTFPKVQPLLCVYMALTECYGPFEFTYRIVDADEARKPVHETRGAVTGSLIGPLAIMELDLRLTKLTFPAPGEYRFQFVVRGSVVSERRLFVDDPRSHTRSFTPSATPPPDPS